MHTTMQLNSYIHYAIIFLYAVDIGEFGNFFY